jgi:hypothetical protein
VIPVAAQSEDGELAAITDDAYCVQWADALVIEAAFRHSWLSVAHAALGSCFPHVRSCIGYTMASGGRAWCGACGWGMSARLADVGGVGSARFALAAIARVGQAIALARDELVQVLFEAVLP